MRAVYCKVVGVGLYFAADWIPNRIECARRADRKDNYTRAVLHHRNTADADTCGNGHRHQPLLHREVESDVDLLIARLAQRAPHVKRVALVF